jgi:hypothetical protein
LVSQEGDNNLLLTKGWIEDPTAFTQLLTDVYNNANATQKAALKTALQTILS